MGKVEKREWVKGRESAPWSSADGGPAARHHVAVGRVRGCTVPLVLERVGTVGDKVCSDRARRAEAGFFRSGISLVLNV
jgi:hypothetical protein